VLESGSAQAQLDELKQRLAALESERDSIKTERDEYQRVYVALLEAYRKLEAGLLGSKRERFVDGAAKEQLALSLLSMLVGQEPPPDAESQTVKEHERRKPTGRQILPEQLPRIEIEIIPPEVQQRGLDAFERIGEETSETVERRPASLVVVRTVRPKYVPKEDAPHLPKVLQAPALEMPIPRALAGPGLLADTIGLGDHPNPASRDLGKSGQLSAETLTSARRRWCSCTNEQRLERHEERASPRLGPAGLVLARN